MRLLHENFRVVLSQRRFACDSRCAQERADRYVGKGGQFESASTGASDKQPAKCTASFFVILRVFNVILDTNDERIKNA